MKSTEKSNEILSNLYTINFFSLKSKAKTKSILIKSFFFYKTKNVKKNTPQKVYKYIEDKAGIVQQN